MTNDAIPELITSDERTKRDTIELCGNEHKSLRCMLARGHEGMHECLATTGDVRWWPLRAV
jgi:hypothetical protein